MVGSYFTLSEIQTISSELMVSMPLNSKATQAFEYILKNIVIPPPEPFSSDQHPTMLMSNRPFDKDRNRRRGQKSKDRSSMDWENVRVPTFVPTKIETKEGIEKQINDFRILLNKISSKNYETQRDLIFNKINEKQIYNYAHENNRLNIKRNEVLQKCINVEFRSLNSLNLVYENSKFDLIWIDGAHGYPTIAIDLINSLRMINSGGIVLCDDVYKYSKSSDPEYQSVGAFETLEELRKAGLIDFHLFLKRINKIYNISKFRRKYIGVFQKI
jgi:hypothetical protein